MKTLQIIVAGLMAVSLLGWYLFLAFVEVALLGGPADDGLDRDAEDAA